MLFSLAVAAVSYNKDAETLMLTFPTELTPGLSDSIEIEYSGTLNDQMKGFYRSKYFHPSAPNEERYAAVTQFEVRLKVLKMAFLFMMQEPPFSP